VSADELVRAWLARRLTGCHFAAALAGRRGGILFSVFPNVATDAALDAFLDLAATQHLPAIGVFPDLCVAGKPLARPIADEYSYLSSVLFVKALACQIKPRHLAREYPEVAPVFEVGHPAVIRDRALELRDKLAPSAPWTFR
jgi:hypothetical protein